MGFINATSFDNGPLMARMLGALWWHWFPERSTVVSLMTARGEPFYQVYLDLLNLAACKSQFNIPVFERKNWHLFTLLESQKNDSAQLENLYDTTGLRYQDADKPAYGDKANSTYFSYGIDPLIKQVHAIYNRVIDPSLLWMNNEDFSVDGDRHIISFYTDPFVDPLVPKRDVLDSNGNVVDREIALWFNMSGWDMELIWEQFGYALGLWMKSSTFYREFISSIWDMLVVGPTQAAFKVALTALTGIPFALDTETVLNIIREANYTHVETDKNIYTFKPATNIIVFVGQQLVPGDALCISVLVIEPEHAVEIPWFKGLSTSSSLMNPLGVGGPIVLENKEVDVQYLGLDANNKAIVRFEVSGFSDDVENFWVRSHKEGLRINRTMADVLDLRTVRATPTTPADLPATVNPFDLVMSHIFIDNLFVIYLVPSTFADGAPGIGALDLLYPYLVPHTTYMIFVEMAPVTDYYTVGDATDSLGTFKGTDMPETMGTFAVDLGPTIRAIPGRCQ